MKRYLALGIVGVLVLCACYVGGRYAWAASTLDYYYGEITQPPKVNPYGEREIGILAPGETVADTLNLEDYCIMPGTEFCRFNTADLHNTFSAGNAYCVTAYGWRFGWASMKPNVVNIVAPGDPAYSSCVDVGAPKS